MRKGLLCFAIPLLYRKLELDELLRMYLDWLEAI